MSAFEGGAVLSRAFGVWARNLVPFTFVSLGCFVPSFVFTYGALHRWFTLSPTAFGVAIVAVHWLLSTVTSGALVYAVVDQLRSRGGHAVRRRPFGDALALGFRSFGVVVVTAFLAIAATAAGLVLVIVPGIILSLAFFVAVPAAVVERLGPIAALSRSWTLTKDRRGTLFGILFLFGILQGGANKILEVIMESDLRSSPSPTKALVYVFIIVFLAALFAPLHASLAGTAYHDLRQEKEFLDDEAIAAVFE